MLNINKLKELCNKYTVEVLFNGFEGFNHKVIDADKLLEDKEFSKITDNKPKEFIENINKQNFMFDEIKDVFSNIKTQRVFYTKGHENLSGLNYIEVNSLNWL